MAKTQNKTISLDSHCLITRLEEFGRVCAGLEEIMKCDFLCTSDPGEFRKRFEKDPNLLKTFYWQSRYLRHAIFNLLDVALPEEDRLYPLKLAYINQKHYFREFEEELEKKWTE